MSARARTREPVEIREYPDEYLACRADRHLWRRITDGDLVRDSRGRVTEWTRHYECVTCTKTRRDTYSTYGQLLARSYTDPPGYSSTADRPIHAPDARTEELRRILVRLGEAA